MDYLSRLLRSSQYLLFAIITLENLVAFGATWAFMHVWRWHELPAFLAAEAIGLVLSGIIAALLGRLLLQPLTAIWQTILHLAPHHENVAPPKLEAIHFGKDVFDTLSTQVYQLATTAEKSNLASRQADTLHTNFIAGNMPLPLFVLDANETILFANQLAADYIGMHMEDLTGKNVYMVLDMAFPSENTFDKWLKDVKIKSATASMSWERVRLNVRDNHPTRLFDLAAYYNRNNPHKWETMLVLFDHTKQYSQDDQAVSFIALSVHELRTPLTLLRGYIEAFEDELAGKLSPDMDDFMQKMSASAQQLTAFVNNILNVARVDDDQLELQLQEEDWQPIVQSAINNMGLRAKVRGINLELTVAPNLPKVGADRLSITEVINNIIDNAIKYSGASKVIKIDSHLTQDGLVETTVQDMGVGIPSSIMPNLFSKFYRDHRNRAQIGGTGLGLYLSKAIVTAHGGNIWVRSKEGEGSTFGFTLQPYDKLADEQKNGNNEIVRGAHGWIKNHSLYRR